MFKEFIQNADDAGARRMHICLDLRSHASAATAWKQNGEDLQVRPLAFCSAWFNVCVDSCT